MTSKLLFLLGLVLVATPWVSPPMALAAGIVFGMAFAHPFPRGSQKISKGLLQLSVVCLGFGMNLHAVLRAGRSGLVYTALGIVFAMTVGLALGALLRVDRTNALLISVGTAICGGSAIAAVGAVTEASDEQMAVSLGTIFILNAVGLMLFPFLGMLLGLSETQFGLWAALAIHDTSSVVGAGARYGAVALAIATTVKLARALWIVPVSLAIALCLKRRRTRTGIQWPWFIGFFLLAAMANTYLPAGAAFYMTASAIGKLGLTVTLYLIGSHISPGTVRVVGARPLLQGVVLWVVVASVSLLLIRFGFVAL